MCAGTVPATVLVQRFGTPRPIGQVPAGGAATVVLPDDDVDRDWVVRVDGGGWILPAG